MKVKKNTKRGALLIEALLSTVILSVGLTLIIQSMVASYRAVIYTAQYTEAIISLETKMNQLRGAREILEPESSLNEDTKNFYEHELQSIASNAPNLDGLNAAVVWTSGKRKNRINVQTYLFKQSEE